LGQVSIGILILGFIFGLKSIIGCLEFLGFVFGPSPNPERDRES